ncbi:hypothetical protein CO168_01365 [Candidatus Shapirobacteria bacterium CG_4_9_14_3_um_filter_36_12]|uniref:Uncharacterized protein n=3 Tax=Candidatus Shapironibacteriota TaxID=1752721 RepID=A0A2M7XNL7_9BACT|nr:MAG: hypothetical protein COS53_00200 [Candidatus Shapirobacteria bacterium CG03_land_8_20_14_0_80_35_14]PIX67975.1 MAG: hypothetical protein COZ41_02160 [Candidatus Shapirobacteria bacterium CG_4_10_14_3_um_filter_35_13]PJA51139.1 MAG: hypothetical protein CO168_01365 [Candidatus Shapirobacteria bacterium CG_4_9_14_3_um_filter_36_12]
MKRVINRKRNINYIIIIGIILFVGLVFYILRYRKYGITEDNSNLVRFTSSNFGFSLRYQPDSKIYYDSDVEGGAKGKPYLFLLSLENIDLAKSNPDDKLYFTLEISDINNKQSGCSTDWSNFENIKNLTQKTISISGIETKFINFIGGYNMDYSNICIVKNNLNYDFYSQGSNNPDIKNKREKYFLEVINSFEFDN